MELVADDLCLLRRAVTGAEDIDDALGLPSLSGPLFTLLGSVFSRDVDAVVPTVLISGSILVGRGRGSQRCCLTIAPGHVARCRWMTGSACKASCSCSIPVSTGSTRRLPGRLACQSKKGGEGTGHSRVDRGRPCSKHHIACDSTGIPLAVITTAGDVPDIKAAPDLVEAIGPVAGGVGRPRRRPDVILADGGCDSAAFRDWLRSKRIEPIIPQRGRKKIIGLGSIRWVVEQAIAHLRQCKRLAVRWDRFLSMHEGFTKRAVSLICWRRLNHVLPCRN